MRDVESHRAPLCFGVVHAVLLMTLSINFAVYSFSDTLHLSLHLSHSFCGFKLCDSVIHQNHFMSIGWGQKITGIFSAWCFFFKSAFPLQHTYTPCTRAHNIPYSTHKLIDDGLTPMSFFIFNEKTTTREYIKINNNKCCHAVYMQYKCLYTSTKISVPSFPGSLNSPTND